MRWREYPDVCIARSEKKRAKLWRFHFEQSVRVIHCANYLQFAVIPVGFREYLKHAGQAVDDIFLDHQDPHASRRAKGPAELMPVALWRHWKQQTPLRVRDQG